MDRSEGTIELDELLVRPWRVEDVDAVRAAGQDPEIARWIHLAQPFGAEQAAAYLSTAMAEGRDGVSVSFAIVDRVDGELLGAVTRFGPDGHGATIGLWLAPGARGRGVGTRVCRLVIDQTFATTRAARIDCYIEVGNEPSMRMVERVGFQREGLLRAWDVAPDGHLIDCVVWSILRTDERWEPVFRT
jgi:RimJ/RimL family protein N-acetyltransferase